MFSGYFPLPVIPQLLPGLPHIKETEVIRFNTHFIFLYKNTVLSRRVVLTAISKNSILISDTNKKGQPSLNYQSAFHQHSNYFHHLEWPKQYFEITSKTVVVIHQGALASQIHDQQKGGDRYYIILILLNNLLLSTKLPATESLHHLNVQNNKQTILWWFRWLLIHHKKKNKLNCIYFPQNSLNFSIHIHQFFIKSQFLSH